MTMPETLVACLTPPGRGAIATLGLRGPRAWSIVRALFQPAAASLPDVPEPARFWFGRMGERKTADEVVVAVRAMEPGPLIDVHCHGGDEVARWLLETMARGGARICTWQEFEQAGADDPLRALARTLLPHATTVRTAAILLDQVHGALTNVIRAAIALLHAGRVAEAGQALDDLLRFAPVGRHLTQPWRLVIAGAPNVGKSSLINALAGFQRAVVAPTPGTTRDVVTTLLAIDGWPVEVADTAGWRTTAEPLEAEGIARARGAAALADLCLWVVDAAAEPVMPVDGDIKVQLVVNKIDLPATWDLAEIPGALHVSAKTGDGLPQLCRYLSEALAPLPPAPGGAVPFTDSLANELENSRQLVGTGNEREAIESMGRMLTHACVTNACGTRQRS